MDRTEDTASARAGRETPEGSSGKAPATCRSCGGGIAWIETVKAKKMPVDFPERFFEPPEDAGKPLMIMVKDVPLSEEMGQELYKGARLTSTDTHKLFGYRSHFASCPNAKRHRRN